MKSIKVSKADERHNLWPETAREAVVGPPLEDNTAADLVIIGGGFTGCSAALHAAERGLEVRLLEKETIGFGGSGRNVGLVNAGLWLPPEAIAAQLGTMDAEKLNAALAAAPDLVFALIEQHDIACEATRAGTLHCAHSAAGLKNLRNRHRQLVAQGAPVTLLTAAETAERTGSLVFHGALHDARAGTIQPLSYCRGLARAAQTAGATLHEGSTVLIVSRDGSQWVVKTPKGAVRAEALLLATNAYHNGASGVHGPAAIPVHYFQMATKPIGDNLLKTILPAGEGCWDTAMVMSSFRRDVAGRVIVGGIGTLEHVGGDIHRAWAARKLASLFPRLADQPLEHAWFGRIAMTSDHIPKILRLGDNAFSIFGYSGRGIGPGTTFGKAAADMFASGNHDGLPLVPVDRYAEYFTTAKQACYETGAILTHLVSSYRTPPDQRV